MSTEFQDAGGFYAWLEQTKTGGSANVPCGDCNACCRASYFIHIGAQESKALAAIPAELRFKAPNPNQDENFANQEVMGFDQNGRCPMLRESGCQVYADRPQTCRDYDCRIFAATGMQAGGKEKQLVNEQVGRWQFSYATPQDQIHQRAVKTAVEFLDRHNSEFSNPPLPENPTQRALLALRIEDLFAENDVENQRSDQDLIEAIRAQLAN